MSGTVSVADAPEYRGVRLPVIVTALPGPEQLVDLVLHLLHLDGGDGGKL